MNQSESSKNRLSRRHFFALTAITPITFLLASSKKSNAQEDDGPPNDATVYVVEHKFQSTSSFGIGATHSDIINTWSRCKKTGGGNANVNAYVKGEVIFYDADGNEVSPRVTKLFPENNQWTNFGNPAVVEGAVTWNTAQYLNGSAGNVKKIVRRYSLYSSGTNNSMPSENPTVKESSHNVN